MLSRRRIDFWRSFHLFTKQFASTSVSTSINSKSLPITSELAKAFQEITKKELSESDKRFVQRYFYKQRPLAGRLPLKEVVKMASVARKYQLYEDGLKLLNEYFDSNGGIPLLMESSLFIADYCAHCHVQDPSVNDLLEKINSVVESMNLPPLIGNPMRIALNYSLLMLGSGKSPPNKSLLDQRRRDTRSQFYLALHFLELATRASSFEEFSKNWKEFVVLFPFFEYPILEMSRVLASLLKVADSVDEEETLKRKTLVASWLYENLCSASKPVSISHWPMLQAFNEYLKFDAISVKIDEKGKFDSRKQGLQLTKQSLILPFNEINETEIKDLREKFNKWLMDRKKSKSSLTSTELSFVQKEIDELKKLHVNGKFLIVDTLNAFQLGQGTAQVRMIDQFLKRLKDDFQSIMLITRRHAVPFLRNFIRTDPRIRLVYGADLTEDDILLLGAALEVGSSAWLLSNDRFQKYIQLFYENFGPSAGDSFSKWIQDRTIRHSPPDHFDKMAHFDRNVRKLETTDQTRTLVLVPVMNETQYIPEFKYQLVILPKLNF